MNTTRLAYSGGLRPKRSVIGPYRDWPRAKPMRNVTMVSCTEAVEVWNTFSITGMAGRYMSIDSGAKACSMPNGPTTFGPLRSWTPAQILRSA